MGHRKRIIGKRSKDARLVLSQRTVSCDRKFDRLLICLTAATMINIIAAALLHNHSHDKKSNRFMPVPLACRSFCHCHGVMWGTNSVIEDCMGESMVDKMISEMGPLYRKGVFTKRTSYRFTFGDTTITVIVEPESYSVEKGITADKVDCNCKTSLEMFSKIWYDGYKPGIMDFMGGAIKADAPFLLPPFLRAFGKVPV
jgi:hypothetical protein